jgi:hypothetical protein
MIKKPSQLIKSALLIVFLFSVLFMSCKKDDDPAGDFPPQDIPPLAGTWEITKMTFTFQGVTEVMTEAQLDSLGIIWIYLFDKDYTMELTTNISGPVVMMPGTWSTTGDQLTTIVTAPDGSPGTVVYKYTITGNLLTLKWDIPSGSIYEGEFTKQ